MSRRFGVLPGKASWDKQTVTKNRPCDLRRPLPGFPSQVRRARGRLAARTVYMMSQSLQATNLTPTHKALHPRIVCSLNNVSRRLFGVVVPLQRTDGCGHRLLKAFGCALARQALDSQRSMCA
jgi:hypothetical protein